MNFEEEPERIAYRAEVTRFLTDQLGGITWDEAGADWNRAVRFCEALADRGWIGAWWPEKYSGAGRPYWEHLILMEELAFWDAPRGPIYIGWDRIAWSLILLWTAGQAKPYLDGIRSIKHVWCQAFTEPEAGSDLASLRTRASRVDGGYVINGQKTFNSYGNHATHALLAARTTVTDDKHDGITLFVLDLASAGVTVRPFADLVGRYGKFNDLFFDDVFVPDSGLIGEQDQGWAALGVTLNAERAGVALSRLGYCRRGLAVLRACWDQLPVRRRTASDLHAELDRLTAEVEVLRLLAYRVAWDQEHELYDEARVHGAMAKLFAGELEQRIYQATYRLWPERMQIVHGDSQAFVDGFFGDHLLQSVAATIAGGSSEVLRSVISRHVFGGSPRRSAPQRR